MCIIFERNKMIERRNEKVARLVLESSLMAEKRQCYGKKKVLCVLKQFQTRLYNNVRLWG